MDTTLTLFALLSLAAAAVAVNESDYSDITDPRIDRMCEEDLNRIWSNIVHQEKVLGVSPGSDRCCCLHDD